MMPTGTAAARSCVLGGAPSLTNLDRFAKEVIPTFRDTRTAAAAQ